MPRRIVLGPSARARDRRAIARASDRARLAPTHRLESRTRRRSSRRAQRRRAPGSAAFYFRSRRPSRWIGFEEGRVVPAPPGLAAGAVRVLGVACGDAVPAASAGADAESTGIATVTVGSAVAVAVAVAVAGISAFEASMTRPLAAAGSTGRSRI